MLSNVNVKCWNALPLCERCLTPLLNFLNPFIHFADKVCRAHVSNNYMKDVKQHNNKKIASRPRQFLHN